MPEIIKNAGPNVATVADVPAPLAAPIKKVEVTPPHYETMISVPQATLSKSDEEVDIVPGMTVVVDLIGKKRSVLDYIMTPLNRATGVVFREN